MWAVYVILAVLLVLLVAYSLRKARRDLKAKRKLSAQTSVGAWASYTLFTVLMGLAAWQSAWMLPIGETASIAVGAAFVVFGLGVYAAGIIEFRSLKRVSGLKSDKLVTSGVYRFSRNPQMVGWGLVLFGIAMFGRSGVCLVLVAFYWLTFHIYSDTEEEYLEQDFGEEWLKYRATTPRYFGWPGNTGQ